MPREPQTSVVLVKDGRELASWRWGAESCDVADVDALARLQLSAKRWGCSIEVRDASQHLLQLLELAGLSDVIPAGAGPQ